MRLSVCEEPMVRTFLSQNPDLLRSGGAEEQSSKSGRVGCCLSQTSSRREKGMGLGREKEGAGEKGTRCRARGTHL
jgi:hypothetical protein